MQVILGAGGAIGMELAKELKQFTDKIRLVSRNPRKVNEDDQLFRANMTNPIEVDKAIAGAEVAYLTVGLQYKTKIWQNDWPLIMKNTLDACKKHNTKLVFFDNVYLYNPYCLYPMNEETEVMPSSRKGKVRALIAQMLMEEVNAGNIKALIARSADFYGPGIENSILNELVIKNLKAGKKANWFCSVKFEHNFTYTPDAAKATALLGNTEKAYGQVWHLPTSKPWTLEQWIKAIALEIGVEPKTQVLPKFLVTMMGLFHPIMKELSEMLYQYDRDYKFDSSKFEDYFDVRPTPNSEGIKQIMREIE